MMQLAKMALLGMLVLALPGQAEEKKTPGATTQFEALKQLSGDWVEAGKGNKVISSFRVTAAGSTVQETLFPGTDHEMVTMYHLDGNDLVLTHYCSMGNQPRMKAKASGDAKKIEFLFTGSGNLKSPDAIHMDHATLLLEDKDHFKALWIACKEGKACHEAKFDLVRKKD